LQKEVDCTTNSSMGPRFPVAVARCMIRSFATSGAEPESGQDTLAWAATVVTVVGVALPLAALALVADNNIAAHCKEPAAA
jgi:hypothetical protein